MITHAQTLRAYDVWSELAGLREGDRYLIVNPFFHTFGYKAGHHRLPAARRHDDPAARLQRGHRARQHRRRADLRTPRPAHPPPAAPRPPRARPARPLRAAPGRHRRRRGPPGAGRAAAQRAEDLHRPDRLRALGGSRHRHDVPPRRPARDHRLHLGPRHPRHGGPGRRRLRRPPLPPGDPGEVQVRGYHVMSGYFEDPAGTARAITPDGWLRTGDVGVLDADGNLRITDRIKDMFIVGGFNAYPAEIEQLLGRHPDIADVAVIGIPDPPSRRGRQGLRGPPRRVRAHRRRPDRLVPPRDGQLQGPARGRLRHRTPAQRQRQDPQDPAAERSPGARSGVIRPRRTPTPYDPGGAQSGRRPLSATTWSSSGASAPTATGAPNTGTRSGALGHRHEQRIRDPEARRVGR